MSNEKKLRIVVIIVSILLLSEGFLLLWQSIGQDGIIGALLVLWGGKMWHAKLEVVS